MCAHSQTLILQKLLFLMKNVDTSLLLFYTGFFFSFQLFCVNMRVDVVIRCIPSWVICTYPQPNKPRQFYVCTFSNADIEKTCFGEKYRHLHLFSYFKHDFFYFFQLICANMSQFQN
jgi:hypothetical protein